MNDQQLLRYSRHILLDHVGIEGQERLLRSRVLIVGMGGLGSPISLYLAASGVGHLTLADYDHVELSNLQRQIVHRSDAIGMSKVESAARTLREVNPEVEITRIDRRLDPDLLATQVALADAVVDGSDNFATRFALNAACVRANTPLIAGAVIRMEGQVMVFRRDRPGGPCYRCLYREGEELAETCSQTGVLAPVAGVIGTVQAVETLKALLDLGTSLDGHLLLLDAMNMEWRRIRLPRDPACPVCG